MDLNSRLKLRPRDQSNYWLPLMSPGLTMAITHPQCLLSRRPEMKLGLLCTVQKHTVAGTWGSLSYCKYRQEAWRIECWISGCFFRLKSWISSPQKSTLCIPSVSSLLNLSGNSLIDTPRGVCSWKFSIQPGQPWWVTFTGSRSKAQEKSNRNYIFKNSLSDLI